MYVYTANVFPYSKISSFFCPLLHFFSLTTCIFNKYFFSALLISFTNLFSSIPLPHYEENQLSTLYTIQELTKATHFSRVKCTISQMCIPDTIQGGLATK